jgi:hypothetical protein
MDTAPKPTRQRAWVTTAEACAALGMSRETLRQLRLRGVLTPGQALPPLGLHPGQGPPAVAPGERGGHHHWLEPQAPAALKATNRT